MNFNLNSFLMATSTALDYVEEEIMHITTHHSKRCAYISLRIGLALNMSKEECFDLCSLALMHDNGITQAFYEQDFLEAGSKKNLKILETLTSHCKIGEYNVKKFPFLSNPKNVILYHHEYIDGSGLYKISSDKIPLMAQIICFADDIDMKFNLLECSIESVTEIENFAKNFRGKLYFENIVDAFLQLSGKISFWRDLNDNAIINAVEKYIPQIDREIALPELLTISSVFSSIIDSKSTFTAQHSNDLMEKAKRIAHYLKWDDEKSIYFQAAANLHDIGKLATPRAILEKDGDLTPDEFRKIKEHAYLTHLILQSIKGFDLIHEWASKHHERNDGSGYPFGLVEAELSFESKLLACLDMYQALVETRPYREALTHNDAVEILREQIPENLFDKEIVELIAVLFADTEEAFSPIS